MPCFFNMFGIVSDISWFKELINKGADVNIKNAQGLTLLSLATISALKGANLGNEIQLLLKNKANANAQDAAGDTPLHYAAAGANKELCELLIENGAMVNAQDGDGDTPLHKVVEIPVFEAEQLEVIALLIKHGADLKLKNKDNKTPADIARIMIGKHKIVRALQNYSAVN